jgi:hypothetical protein
MRPWALRLRGGEAGWQESQAGRRTCAAAGQRLEVLEKHEQQQQQIAGFALAVALLEQNIEHRETAGSHNERGLPYAPDHQPIEDRFGRSARRAAKFVAFWTFTGKGNVLNVVGYKIEPEQLRGKGIGKPRGIASRKGSNSAAPATSA